MESRREWDAVADLTRSGRQERSDVESRREWDAVADLTRSGRQERSDVEGSSPPLNQRPYRRSRWVKERSARRKSTFRKSGHSASQK